MSCPQPAPGSDGEAVVRGTTVELLLEERDWARALAEADAPSRAAGRRGQRRLGAVAVAEGPGARRARAARRGAGAPRGGAGRGAALGRPGIARRARCGCWARCATRTGSTCCTRRSRPPLARRRVSSTPRRSPRSGRRCGSHGGRRTRGRRCGDAFEIASHCGAQPLAEHARDELYAAGGRPRRQALTGPESLTPSERRIAELAAAGQSNRDIARALYVTPKTVEVHLTSVYRKLGIRSRAGLVDAL